MQIDLRLTGKTAVQVGAVSLTSFILAQHVGSVALSKLATLENFATWNTNLEKVHFTSLVPFLGVFAPSKRVKLVSAAIGSLLMGFSCFECHGFFDDNEKNQWVEAVPLLKDISWKVHVPVLVASVAALYLTS